MRDARHDQRDAADACAGIGVKFDRRDVAVERWRPEDTEARSVVGDGIRGYRTEHFRVGRVAGEAHRQVRIRGDELQRNAERRGIGRNDLQLRCARAVGKRLPREVSERDPLRRGSDVSPIADGQRTPLQAFGQLLLHRAGFRVLRLHETALCVARRRKRNARCGGRRGQHERFGQLPFAHCRFVFSRAYGGDRRRTERNAGDK